MKGESTGSEPSELTKDEILAALGDLSTELGKAGVRGEACIFGGTVMVLAYATRVSTKDVDAIFQPAQTIRTIAARVADARGWSRSWLNDGVKGFVSSRQDFITGNLPQFEHLKLTMPTPEYLLAMKCMASRLDYSAPDEGDVRDIRFLIQHLGLKTPAEVFAVVAGYYPPDRIPVKAQYLVESLFEGGAR